MSSTGVALLILWLLLAPRPFLRAQQSPIDIHIALSKTEALFGEPIWVDLTVTNRSSGPLAIDWGTDCCGSHPITIHIPGTGQRDAEEDFCGGMACDCASPGPTPVAPNSTIAHRYVLAGDFRLTHPGEYTVTISKTIGFGPSQPHLTLLSRDSPGSTVTTTLTLKLLPPDPAKLLTIEQAYAAEAIAPYKPRPYEIPKGLDQEATMAAIRAQSTAERERANLEMQQKYALFAGLAAFPAAGMEPTFESWQTPPRSVGYGVAALKQLNTPAARGALARLATLPAGPANQQASVNATRMGAVDSLSRMGDRSYIRLLEKSSRDPVRDVRVEATIGLGRLGGDPELPFLNDYATNSTDPEDQRNATQAMFLTHSSRAVPLMIALLPSVPDTNYWLLALTHHQVPNSSPANEQAAWRSWWAANSATAPMYGPGDCIDAARK